LKRFLQCFSLLAVILLSFSLVGCGTNSASTKDTKTDEKAVAQVKKSEAQPKILENPIKQPQTESEKAVVNEKKAESSQPAAADKTENKVANSVANTTAPTTTTTKKTKIAPSKKIESKTETKEASPAATTNKTTVTTKPPVKTIAPKPAETVTLSIKGPKDQGTILSAAKVDLKEGDTVLKVLLNGAGKKGIDVDYSGSGATAYVKGIDNVYEFDYGTKSGWTCQKNGVTLPKSAGTITVKAGDRIDWIYTEDYSEQK